MRFGEKLRNQRHAPWEEKFVPYELLKQTINQLHDDGDCQANAATEGIFLTQLLAAMHQVLPLPLPLGLRGCRTGPCLPRM
jgi:SPX domain protein involved in polyphosphate accumulation